MNVYDSLKLASREGWMIDFDARRQSVKIISVDKGQLASEHWHNETGLVTPVTALIRAIHTAAIAGGYLPWKAGRREPVTEIKREVTDLEIGRDMEAAEA